MSVVAPQKLIALCVNESPKTGVLTEWAPFNGFLVPVQAQPGTLEAMNGTAMFACALTEDDENICAINRTKCGRIPDPNCPDDPRYYIEGAPAGTCIEYLPFQPSTGGGIVEKPTFKLDCDRTTGVLTLTCNGQIVAQENLLACLQQFFGETITTLIDNGSGEWCYTNEAGTEVCFTIDQETITNLAYNSVTNTICYTNEANTVVCYALPNETITTFYNNAAGDICYTNEAGTEVCLPIVTSDLYLMQPTCDDATGIITFPMSDGSSYTLDISGKVSGNTFELKRLNCTAQDFGNGIEAVLILQYCEDNVNMELAEGLTACIKAVAMQCSPVIVAITCEALRALKVAGAMMVGVMYEINNITDAGGGLVYVRPDAPDKLPAHMRHYHPSDPRDGMPVIVDIDTCSIVRRWDTLGNEVSDTPAINLFPWVNPQVVGNTVIEGGRYINSGGVLRNTSVEKGYALTQTGGVIDRTSFYGQDATTWGGGNITDGDIHDSSFGTVAGNATYLAPVLRQDSFVNNAATSGSVQYLTLSASTLRAENSQMNMRHYEARQQATIWHRNSPGPQLQQGFLRQASQLFSDNSAMLMDRTYQSGDSDILVDNSAQGSVIQNVKATNLSRLNAFAAQSTARITGTTLSEVGNFNATNYGGNMRTTQIHHNANYSGNDSLSIIDDTNISQDSNWNDTGGLDSRFNAVTVSEFSNLDTRNARIQIDGQRFAARALAYYNNNQTNNRDLYNRIEAESRLYRNNANSNSQLRGTTTDSGSYTYLILQTAGIVRWSMHTSRAITRWQNTGTNDENNRARLNTTMNAAQSNSTQGF